MRKYLLLIVITVVVFGFLGCTKNSGRTIVIGHKNYAEQRILARYAGLYIENKLGHTVEYKEISPTILTHTALRNGDIDFYMEYTGTYYSVLLHQTDRLSDEDTFEYIKREAEAQHNITFLEPLGFNNSNIMVVNQDILARNNWKTISDMRRKAPTIALGGDLEFGARIDGYPGMIRAYGFSFKSYSPMEVDEIFEAVSSGRVDAGIVYGTDGRINKNQLITLEDDLNFFMTYYPTPILSIDRLMDDPDLVQALEELGGTLTEEDMRRYNLRVDEGESPLKVAREMLQTKGLID